MKKQQTKSRIKELRVLKSISQIEMAEELGVSQQTISRLENCPDRVPVDLLINIATRYNVSVDYLLGLTRKQPFSGTSDQAFHFDKVDLLKDYAELSMENKLMVKAIIQALLVQQASLS
ncbi:MAG: helix-turn-helix domain-containing protein [Lachnospiraceae bacterium]|nr:helix-turn-helix domain-containing protein [Lachnospiraceae bacterium]